MTKNRERDIRIPFYINENEQEILEQNMKTANMENRSEYIRKMILKGVIIHTDLSVIKELSFQISKVGNNINQIARIGNETGEISDFHLEQLKNGMDEISGLYRETLLELTKVADKE